MNLNKKLWFWKIYFVLKHNFRKRKKHQTIVTFSSTEMNICGIVKRG